MFFYIFAILLYDSTKWHPLQTFLVRHVKYRPQPIMESFLWELLPPPSPTPFQDMLPTETAISLPGLTCLEYRQFKQEFITSSRSVSQTLLLTYLELKIKYNQLNNFSLNVELKLTVTIAKLFRESQNRPRVGEQRIKEANPTYQLNPCF